MRVLACDLALGGAGRLLSGLFCVLLRALVVCSIFAPGRWLLLSAA